MEEVSFAVNDHFEDFIFNWDYKDYFLVGGYGSSKSYHVATKILLKLQQEKRKCLVVREVYDTIRDSCYSLFEDIVVAMGLEDKIKFKSSPMKILFPNGSQIIFKGLDKPAKLKSINGVSIVWLEECSECKYAAFKELRGRLRHLTDTNHIICSTNPVEKANWTYSHYFIDEENDNIVLNDDELYEKRVIITNNTYYHHSTCDDNYYLPQDYIEELEKMKTYDIDLYRVARLGRYGVNGTRVLPQFQVMPDEWIQEQVGGISSRWYRYGMDFGFETSYNALISMAIDDENKDLYIFNQYYKNKMTDDKTAIEIADYKDKLITADCAEPKTIKYYQQQGFRMRKCKKFAGSRLQNTKKVKRFRNIYCSDACKDVVKELKNLTYATDAKGNIIYDEFNIDPHSFSAIWYGLDDYEVADLKRTYNSR
ncbi:PBSX family phage terminase large subunit [Romboutsia timonensis]|uniref:PBSX family phage terminase large subunit n=1 Tax=Romboutsia timonensis TaxID=1776391 RepID=UPI0008DAE21D|nr:PBSX family phage terminase large subunit [Romboutsia timonensis]